MSISIFPEEDARPLNDGAQAERWKNDSAEVLSFLKNTGGSVYLRGVHDTALAYFMARGIRSLRNTFVLITPTDRDASKFAESISFFLGRDDLRTGLPLRSRILYFPSRTGHKAQWLGKMENTARRVEVLYALRSSSAPLFIVTSALAIMERLPPPEAISGHSLYFVKGEEIDGAKLVRRLVEGGYYRVSLVEEYGDFSQRGSVIDIYAPLYHRPLRIEMFGDELESIRLFHPSTQRSLEVLEEMIVLPASEVVLDESAHERAQSAVYEDVRKGVLSPTAGNVWLERFQEGHQSGAFESVLPIFYDKMPTLLDYLDPSATIVWSDSARIRSEMQQRTLDFAADSSTEQSPNEWKRPASELFEEQGRLEEESKRFQQIWVDSLIESTTSKVYDLGSMGHDRLALEVKSHASRERLLEPVARQFQKWQGEGVNVFLVCSHGEQAGRLADLLNGYGVEALTSNLPFGEESYTAPVVKVIVGSLEAGFFWPREKLAVVCEEEIFGKRARRRSQKSLSGIFLDSFQDLHAGDPVVHVDHGIGIYKELVHLNVRGIESDFLLLEYQDNDRLYVPVDKLQKVQKYLGIEGQEPHVDKLGGRSWETAKRKAKEAAERIAEELLQLYASRQVDEGFQFSAPDKYFREFEASFAYEETPDQTKAIEDVLDDMASPRVMDRLVCGDVGYGKTEVALRAAFKAVMDGKQVVVLVPTTVLVEQHYHTFKERFEGFPTVVESLSRFKTQAQQKQILEGLKAGAIDIVVGTHRLLQKDVVLRDLGVLIIDEEHRFGVKHKERLKQLRVSVDVLTLTATPIPRTLHMSLTGIRDLSIIETAPQDRHAIETYVCKYDELTIKEAICRELHRGGQVFFVHNHVKSIYQMAAKLTELVPDGRVGVAHGQMKGRDLEKVMLDFVHRKIDVLVCTTIIESGLDIPTANTIVINRADRFGLAQIYQLRGRVGRSSDQAYAYLLIPDENLISRDAQKRLRALLDFSELGAGFKIALNDLQIRGGGTVLGAAQSGHIAAVGYELYLELLQKTIREMKGEKAETQEIDPEINVSLSAFLPEDFMPDTDQRLVAYKRLATAGEERDIDDLTSEWRDRYGPFPDSVRNLILLAKMRLLFKRQGIARLDGDDESFVMHVVGAAELDRLSKLLEKNKCNFRTELERKVKVEIWARHLPQRLLRLKRILQEVG